MSILRNARDAWFAVRRDGQTLKVQGKDLFEKIRPGDEFVVQRDGKPFKFTANWAEFPWEETFGWYHIKNVTGGELKLQSPSQAKTEMWDQYGNPVSRIEPVPGREYFVCIINNNKEQNKFHDNPGINWDFGDQSDVHLLRNGSAMFKNCPHFNGNVDCFRDIPWLQMQEMFMGCTRFNQNISEWYGCGRIGNEFEQDRMFFGCAAFNQDLSQWCGIKTESGSGYLYPADVFTGSGIENNKSKQINFDCRIKDNYPKSRLDESEIDYDWREAQ